MKCPYCHQENSRVVDSRSTEEGVSIRRRRECTACDRRFTTYERLEEVPLMVVKTDGRREAFSRQKVRSGILRACEKRPIGMADIEGIVDKVEMELRNSLDKEIPSQVIGESVMEHLRSVDEVAYVRFASVYRQFKDLNRFIEELQTLLGGHFECGGK